MTKFNLYDSAQDEFYRIAVEKGWIKVSSPVTENANSKSGLSKRADALSEATEEAVAKARRDANPPVAVPAPVKPVTPAPPMAQKNPSVFDAGYENPPAGYIDPRADYFPGKSQPVAAPEQLGPVQPKPNFMSPSASAPAAKKQGDPLVVKVQQKLQENKYNVGPHGVDGQWGHDTQRAWDALIQKAKAQGINTTSIVGKRPSRQELQYFYANGVLATPNEGLRPNPYADDGAAGEKNNVVAAVDFTISHLTKIASALDNNGFAGLANIIDETIKMVATKK